MRALILAVGLCGLAVAPVLAQSVEGALLNAVAYDEIPRGTALSVRTLDDSDDNLVVKQEFEKALRNAGFRVLDDAPLIMTIETRGSVGAFTGRNERHLLSVYGGGGRGGGEDATARLNVFDSVNGGIINSGEDKPDTEIITPTQYRVDVAIENKSNRHRLWQAWATTPMSETDNLTLTLGMVPPIVQAVGTTVRRQPLQLP